MAYIELNRKFWAVNDKEDVDPDSLRYQYLWSRDSQPGWSELLQLPRVVVLAEAGTGKSEEFKETAHRLRSEEKAAFFCAIEELVAEGIERAFDVGTFCEFNAWQKTDQPGWFFLDSVDEARLVNHDHFKRALKSISRVLDSAAQRAFVYISGRGSDWNAISDLALIEEWLPLPQKQNPPQDNEPVTNIKPAPNENNEEAVADRKIQVFRLAPLSPEQIQLFARHRGVADPPLFIKAIERADAGVFAERPRDLIDLIEYWKQSGRIGSLAEMTEYNVQEKLTESNPNHDNHNPLSPDKARAGAETVAAALTFSRCSFIALPDPQSPTTTSAHSLDAKSLLAGWQSNEVESLLRRALFDEATYGRAKIHHRSVREYLTAQWLHHLLQQGKSRRSIEQLIFAERYGMQVVIPSMKPVAGWLALWDDKICQRLCDLAPEILIAYGDPSQLPIPVRERLLRKFAEVCAANRYYDESSDLSAVRRLADVGLANTINQLLKEYRSNEKVRKLLLRTIWQGEIKECAKMALSFGLDASMDRYTRLNGIRAIGVCGTSEQQERLVTAILAATESNDVELTSAVCEQFFPLLISVKALLEVVERIPQPKRFSINPVAHALEKIIECCPEPLLLPILSGLVRLLGLEPYISNRSCEVSQIYAWLIPHAANITHRLLVKRPPFFDEIVLRAVELVSQSRHYRTETHYGSQPDLQTIIDDVPQLRYQFFWRAVERVRRARSKKGERLDDWCFVRFEAAPWKVISEDFEYFLAQAEFLSGRDDQLVAYSVALNLWHEVGRDKTRLKRLKKLAGRNTELAAKLDSFLRPPPMSPVFLENQREEATFQRDQKNRERQQKKNRQAWINRLQTNPQQLRDISNTTVESRFPDLNCLATNIREHKDQGISKWGVDRWDGLIDEFGLEVAEAARDGLMAYWRHYRPKLKSEHNTNEIPNGLIVGMIGLAIEAKNNPDWARQLSHEEAVLAARYATHEMSGFPDWIGDLLTTHPTAIDEVIKNELIWEVGLKGKQNATLIHHMLAQLRYSGPDVLRDRYRPFVFQLLAEREPLYDETLEDALSILLTWDKIDIRIFSELAKLRHFESKDEKRILTWLVAWLCVEADGAIEALQGWLSQTKEITGKKEKIFCFCGAMGDHHFNRFDSRHRDFERIEILRNFVPLIYKMVRIEDDHIHEGVFTPDARDDAECMRGYLLNKVCEMPGRAAFETLLEFSKTLPHKHSRERMQVLALCRAAADAELATWSPADVVKFAQEGEKRPATARELFDLVCSRLDDIKYALEGGDASIATILQQVDQETELRIWFTKELRDAARGKYSIAPEEELADAKRPDIRVDVPEINSPCAIELKISDNWSYQVHIERLHNQLVGQYLRDAHSRFGVFLLVRRKKKRWLSDRMLTFEELITYVQEEADRIIKERPDLDAIKVVGIDLMRRQECGGTFTPTAPRAKQTVRSEKP